MHGNPLSETRHSIMLAMKQDGSTTIAGLSSRLKLTREAVRQHLLQLEREGWIRGRTIREAGAGGGRPSVHYSLTSEGEHLFPKNYAALSVEMLDIVAGQLGPGALEQLLAAMTDARIREWEPRLRGLDLAGRVEALKGIYSANDSFMDVNNSDGQLRLIESNCPFLEVAGRRPVLCSVTVSAMTRLLGYRVEREERFQDGDGRCVFHAKTDQPLDEAEFHFKPED